MKMIKRMAAAVLAAVMAMVVLTACSSISPTQEKVRNELNEARAQNGVAALEWSEEANAHARDFANEYQKLVEASISGSSRLDSELDEKATASKKEELIEKQKSDHYTEVTDGYKEAAEFELNEKAWATVKFNRLFGVAA